MAKRKRKQPGQNPRPTIDELRRACAENGQFEPLLAEIVRTPAQELQRVKLFDLLLEALEVRASRDPAEFADTVMSRLLAFVTLLMIRTQTYASAVLRWQDAQSQGRGHSDLEPGLVERLLPRLLELQAHFAELCERQAGTARLWRLARRHQSVFPEKSSAVESPQTNGRSTGNGYTHFGPHREAREEFLARAQAEGRCGIAGAGPQRNGHGTPVH